MTMRLIWFASIMGVLVRNASSFQQFKVVNNNIRSFQCDDRVGSLAASFYVDTNENAVRDIANMDEWSYNVGIERMNGLELGTEDGLDYSVYMSDYVDPGNFLLKVPARVILSSYDARQEFNLQRSIDFLHSLGAGNNASDFYLFVKILVEVEKGDDSPWFHWLNSTPRLFYNAISMTGKVLYYLLSTFFFHLLKLLNHNEIYLKNT